MNRSVIASLYKATKRERRKCEIAVCAWQSGMSGQALANASSRLVAAKRLEMKLAAYCTTPAAGFDTMSSLLVSLLAEANP